MAATAFAIRHGATAWRLAAGAAGACGALLSAGLAVGKATVPAVQADVVADRPPNRSQRPAAIGLGRRKLLTTSVLASPRDFFVRTLAEGGGDRASDWLPSVRTRHRPEAARAICFSPSDRRCTARCRARTVGSVSLRQAPCNRNKPRRAANRTASAVDPDQCWLEPMRVQTQRGQRLGDRDDDG